MYNAFFLVLNHLLECRPHVGHPRCLQVLEFVHEGLEVLLPAGLDVARGVLEGQKHVAVTAGFCKISQFVKL